MPDIRIAKSLCLAPETITTLLLSYTLMQNYKFFFLILDKTAGSKAPTHVGRSCAPPPTTHTHTHIYFWSLIAGKDHVKTMLQ